MSNLKKWQKIGQIFSPGKYDWMYSHAQNPLPQHLGGSLYRVHFATRDKLNRSRGGFFVIDLKAPNTILDVSASPTIDLGELGTFDDAGVMPSGLANHDEKIYLYYTGWSKTVDVPFAFHIGLALSDDGGKTFLRASRAPVLGRNHFDPFITGAPFVLRENSVFRMWYISGTKWLKEGDAQKPKHFYTIKYADSIDGIQWRCSNNLCIQYREAEYAIARPVVWSDDDGYHMWFTFRGGSDTYRVGIANSKDGVCWERAVETLELEVSESGWDSEMICYAHPVHCDGEMFAFYNGNSYGQSGIGLAVLK